MKKFSLVSNYTIAKYKVHKSSCNEEKVENVVDRNFEPGQKKLSVVVSDLTYVRVGGKWNYICILMDLHNREIIGYSVGKNKNADLVYQAFLNCKYSLDEISIFHTDRGNEFRNNVIDEVMAAFNIKRSLSKKGCPYDNAVMESFYKTLKTEFIKGKNFADLFTLKVELSDYINWYNNWRLHGGLGYLTPVEFKYKREMEYGKKCSE